MISRGSEELAGACLGNVLGLACEQLFKLLGLDEVGHHCTPHVHIADGLSCGNDGFYHTPRFWHTDESTVSYMQLKSSVDRQC